MVRRIIVTSPESSLHARRAVLVFARAKMCGHLPLVCSSNVHRESHRLLFRSFPVTEKLARLLSGRRLFPFSGIILSMGRYDLVHDDLRPCGDLESLQSKQASVGRSLVNVNLSYPSHDIL